MRDYQWEVLKDDPTPKKDLSKWQSEFGPRVIERDSVGIASKIRFKLLIDNPKVRVFLIGNFNNWGKDSLENYELKHDSHSLFATIEVANVKHKDEYKFLVGFPEREMILEDPAGVYFTDNGNTVFWDYEDPSAYKQKYDFIDTFNRSTKVIQTDLPGLIVHFANKQGICGRDVDRKSYYKFIAECGIIQEIKKLGFNTIQFLPFAQNIDGDNWKYRYLVPFQFAIQKNWGNPDDFAYMIDMFHKEGIAVIGDFVLGHLPHKDYQIFGQSWQDHGIHHWLRRDGYLVYMKEETSWGTIRIDFDNSHVRAFFISSCLHFLKYYKIDGLRIDNVDGIIRFNDHGTGDERPNGRTFLRELNSTIYDYNPMALIHFEAHYYYNDNAKMLVAPLASSDRALGATCYNSSRVTYYFHTTYMLESADDTTVWKYKHINEEKEWGKSNSTIADFHNHDAAAGLMANRATGSYAYDTMMQNPGNHIHALGKIKVMEAIISFCLEGRTLNLLQTFLLQAGTFEHDSSIQWFLTFNEANRNTLAYKQKVNEIMDDPAFWPVNVNKREFFNVDDRNKILVVKREAENSKYVVVINTSSWVHRDYRVGVDSDLRFELVMNSDEFKYAGFGMISYPKVFQTQISNNFELLDREVVLPVIAPYGVVILKEKG